MSRAAWRSIGRDRGGSRPRSGSVLDNLRVDELNFWQCIVASVYDHTLVWHVILILFCMVGILMKVNVVD